MKQVAWNSWRFLAFKTKKRKKKLSSVQGLNSDAIPASVRTRTSCPGQTVEYRCRTSGTFLTLNARGKKKKNYATRATRSPLAMARLPRAANASCQKKMAVISSSREKNRGDPPQKKRRFWEGNLTRLYFGVDRTLWQIVHDSENVALKWKVWSVMFTKASLI